MRWIMLAALSAQIACAQSMRPFEPTAQVSVEEEIVKQSGLAETRSGMPCIDFYRAELTRCEESWNCTPKQERGLQRDIMRVRHSFSCKIYFGPEARAILGRR